MSVDKYVYFVLFTLVLSDVSDGIKMISVKAGKLRASVQVVTFCPCAMV